MLSRRLLLAALAAVAVAPATAQAASPPGRGPAQIVNPDGPARVPWQAALVRVADDGNVYAPLAVFCGATVRDATHVITAAHCVDGDDAASLAVVAGAVTRSDPEPSTEVSFVSAISSHPGYDADYRNDLAILTLDEPLTLDGAAITTLPVIAANQSAVGAQALISGWGDLDPDTPGGQQPDELQFARIGVYADSACAAYGAGFDANVMLCAGGSNGGGTVDTCQGDSGGPLARLASASTADALIGVVSWGNGCANPRYPGIYTKLSNPDLNARATAANPPARLEPTTPPTIGGTPRAGETLTCGGAGWTLPPAQQQVLWLSGAPTSDGVQDIRAEGGAASLALTDALVGRVVTCVVRGVNSGGAREQQAQAVGPVQARPSGGGNPPPPGGGGTPPGGGGTPPGGGGTPPGGTQPPPADILPPTVSITRRACAKLRCSLTVTATDLASAVSSATVSYQRLSGCPKGRKGARCRAVKTVKAKRTADGVFQFRTPKLAAARWRFTVIATDAAGNRSAPRAVELKVKR